MSAMNTLKKFGLEQANLLKCLNIISIYSK